MQQLELQRQAALTRLQKQAKAELALKRKAAQEQQQAQDARWDAEVRQPEVARCAQFAAARRRRLAGGMCSRRRCDGQDYCTYLHDGEHDLPPHCRWFADGDCHNGPDCWYNHLPPKPLPIPVPHF